MTGCFTSIQLFVFEIWLSIAVIYVRSSYLYQQCIKQQEIPLIEPACPQNTVDKMVTVEEMKVET
ncbi:uncharacterized protein PHALS_09684 [Plasmopara halstedii]|uniref:Uncharacterized protein n=1 Tax=Plasmopara halstedii TaxID=4781 RepID=A0A0P1AFM9_PLAHL|nr:uncharacterized protein PHALS_09684 [Plasmopara halstedii]CEG39437.1 hypothetical protein PHALS_09684 [Plasmopara halstedii]|eukprot:XP_024575806.1 hypothetical protein PHALS_09684 [Plasmopara halstedii]